MVKRIIWTATAQLDRKEIFAYWNKRNGSNYYSIKLNKLFIEASELLSVHPHTGRETSLDKVRVKIVRDYLMVYKFTDTEVQILSIFDTRQNPEKLEDFIIS